MLRVAAWILQQESRAVNWIVADDATPADVLALQFALAAGSSPIWGTAMITPYVGISQARAATTWAVADLASPVGKRTFYNYFPRTRAFASRGGWRFAATRVGSKFLGPVGVALLMYDAWSTGIWIGEQLFGEMD